MMLLFSIRQHLEACRDLIIPSRHCDANNIMKLASELIVDKKTQTFVVSSGGNRRIVMVSAETPL